MATSRAQVDASQVESYARRLELAARVVEQEAEQFQQQWGEEWAAQMRATVAVDSGQTRAAIQQVEPGGITFGDRAHIARFLENGTSRMAPRPFIRPAMKRIRTPAKKDAASRAVALLRSRA